MSAPSGEPKIPRLPRFSQSLERGLAILGCFTPQRTVLGIADLADDLGMSRSTTHRYVITLVALGYLEQGASRKYRLGLRVTDLGMAVLDATGLREQARPSLEALRKRTRLTTSMAILDGNEVVYLDRLQSHRAGHWNGKLILAVGSRLPAHAGALGKLLLAYLPEQELRTIVADLKLDRRGPNTIRRKHLLLADLEAIRDRGIATSDQEIAVGVCAIAAPVRDEAGDVIAAIGLTAPTSTASPSDLIDVHGCDLIAAADRVSARLGFRPQPAADAA